VPKAKGVQYFSIDVASASFFRCEPYKMTLSIEGCAKRWTKSQTLSGQRAESFEKCRGCPIGAQHAGHAIVLYSILYQSPICPRCGKSNLRMIDGTRCVNCYNREIEFKRGRNSKGTAPRMKPLHRRSIRVSIDNGPIKVITSQHSADTVELMLGAMRRTRGQVLFGLYGRAPALRQGRLF
jgi:hypothetical protein